MRNWGSTIGRLADAQTVLQRLRPVLPTGLAGVVAPLSADREADAAHPLTERAMTGANPGNLRMFSYQSARLPAGAPLVVVLHGCGQTAAGYVEVSGWRALADAHEFTILAPEQQSANNPRGCFNWFRPGDTTRGTGEAASIQFMIEQMIREDGIDPARVYVTGLSAGGAMASALLALYPEVFAGGALVAGMPFRSATSVPEAFEAMFHVRPRTAAAQGDLVREAAGGTSSHWPRIAVWQGDADETVVPGNADELVKQWLNVHGLSSAPTFSAETGGVAVRRWSRNGEVCVEEVRLAGVGHGTPIDAVPGSPPAPHMLDVGLSSSEHIARFFGLVRGDLPMRMQRAPSTAPTDGVGDVAETILRAVRGFAR